MTEIREGADEVENGALMNRLAGVARDALRQYDVSPDASISLLDVSENATFRVDGTDGSTVILRVHRLNYHSKKAINSEISWLDALRKDAGVRTPAPVASINGERVVLGRDGETGEQRSCALFEFLPGTAPTEDDVVNFEQLGEVTARMHLHSRIWKRPAGFTRFSWDLDAAFGEQPRWGRWRDAPGVDTEELKILSRLESKISQRLRHYGMSPERFGLVHADTRLANLLVDGGNVSVIDFDDCGFSWFLYDLGTAVSFFEEKPHVPELIDHWLTGYRRVARLSGRDEREIWTFILYRRLLLAAWIGSHSTVATAKELADHYVGDSCILAESYLTVMK